MLKMLKIAGKQRLENCLLTAEEIHVWTTRVLPVTTGPILLPLIKSFCWIKMLALSGHKPNCFKLKTD